MTSGGNRYPEKADLGAGRTGRCRRDLIARVSLMPAPVANATVPKVEAPMRSGPIVVPGIRAEDALMVTPTTGDEQVITSATGHRDAQRPLVTQRLLPTFRAMP